MHTALIKFIDAASLFVKVIAAATLLVFVFFAGAVTAGIRNWFAPVVEISLVNNSGQGISDIQLTLETAGQKTISSLGSIENNQMRTYRFYIAGEGGYSLVATLANGRKVSSEAGYVQAGSIKETVMASSIKSESSLY